ncbi:hypothetical protein L1987_20814 [Smallanthus sonchifolius]|uniref:Uncharacterized protein n=1 Tax=Smallanthus sonchifolius TaxID=185202 RepID=A0ACB9IUC1_9ASTR|nr:hypothetical protein L1987_20814 [Smallanthus sonchifolius]
MNVARGVVVVMLLAKGIVARCFWSPQLFSHWSCCAELLCFFASWLDICLFGVRLKSTIRTVLIYPGDLLLDIVFRLRFVLYFADLVVSMTGSFIAAEAA